MQSSKHPVFSYCEKTGVLVHSGFYSVEGSPTRIDKSEKKQKLVPLTLPLKSGGASQGLVSLAGNHQNPWGSSRLKRTMVEQTGESTRRTLDVTPRLIVESSKLAEG